MVASTDIKFYVHTNTNAPQLDNVQGGMVDVLDAVLVNGFSTQSISSMTAVGKAVTVNTATSHNFMQYQVIEIAGTAQSDYNGQHRILTVPTANSITFELVAVPSASTATGTMTCKLPPLGWSLPFTGTGKRAYKNTDPSSPYLRVVDAVDPAYTTTYAKYAKVGMVEGMTDINTMIGHQAPFDGASPDKNWVGTGSGTSAINGWAKWFYATNVSELSYGSKTGVPTSGARSWVIVGNGETFYIFAKNHHTVNLQHVAYGFGKLKNLSKIGADPYFLAASNDPLVASGTIGTGASALTSTRTDSLAFNFMFKNYKNESLLTTVLSKVFGGTTSENTGALNTFAAPTAQIDVFSSEYIYVENLNIPRGTIPLLRWLHQTLPYTHLQAVVDSGRMMLPCSCVANTAQGQVLIDLGAL